MTNFQTDLVEKVRDALSADERTAELTVEITDQNGVITLEGWVPSDEARRMAGEVAGEVPGVSAVINDLNVGEGDEVENPIPATLAGDEQQTGINDALP